VSKQGVTVRECVRADRTYEDKFYSDEEIRELFPDDETTLVIALLNRAQQAEAERDEARDVARYFQRLYGGLSESDVDMWPWIASDSGPAELGTWE
jgi:hypothetical protein